MSTSETNGNALVSQGLSGFWVLFCRQFADKVQKTHLFPAHFRRWSHVNVIGWASHIGLQTRLRQFYFNKTSLSKLCTYQSEKHRQMLKFNLDTKNAEMGVDILKYCVILKYSSCFIFCHSLFKFTLDARNYE